MAETMTIAIDDESAYLLFDRLRRGKFDDDAELKEAICDIVDHVKTRSVPARFRVQGDPTLWP